MKKLTLEEKNAIKSLKKLAKNWPKSLWLYSFFGIIRVMRYKEDGKIAEGWKEADLSEKEITKAEQIIGNCLWEQNYRRTDQ